MVAPESKLNCSRYQDLRLILRCILLPVDSETTLNLIWIQELRSYIFKTIKHGKIMFNERKLSYFSVLILSYKWNETKRKTYNEEVCSESQVCKYC